MRMCVVRSFSLERSNPRPIYPFRDGYTGRAPSGQDVVRATLELDLSLDAARYLQNVLDAGMQQDIGQVLEDIGMRRRRSSDADENLRYQDDLAEQLMTRLERVRRVLVSVASTLHVEIDGSRPEDFAKQVFEALARVCKEARRDDRIGGEPGVPRCLKCAELAEVRYSKRRVRAYTGCSAYPVCGWEMPEGKAVNGSAPEYARRKLEID